MRLAFLVALALAAPLEARAQLAAARTAEHQRRRSARASAETPNAGDPEGIGSGLTFGWSRADGGATGGFGRLEVDVLQIYTPSRLVSGVAGIQSGIEAWGSKPDWGVGIPYGGIIGIRAFPLRATAGAGVHAIFVDRVAGDTGVGLFAPYASVRVSLDVLGLQLGVDGRVVRRWQIGADDFTQWQLGIFACFTMDARGQRRR